MDMSEVGTYLLLIILCIKDGDFIESEFDCQVIFIPSKSTSVVNNCYQDHFIPVSRNFDQNLFQLLVFEHY